MLNAEFKIFCICSQRLKSNFFIKWVYLGNFSSNFEQKCGISVQFCLGINYYIISPAQMLWEFFCSNVTVTFVICFFNGWRHLLSVTYDARKLYLKLIDNFIVLILMRKKFQQVLSTNCKISAVFFYRWLTIVNKNSVSRWFITMSPHIWRHDRPSFGFKILVSICLLISEITLTGKLAFWCFHWLFLILIDIPIHSSPLVCNCHKSWEGHTLSSWNSFYTWRSSQLLIDIYVSQVS